MRTVRHLPWTFALAFFVSASPLEAQAIRWEIDGNAARMQYDSAAALNAPTLSSRIERRGPSTFSRLTAGVTGFENAGWSAQGKGELAGWFTPLENSPLLRLELSGWGAASRHSSGFHSLFGRGDARLHVGQGAVGGWVGLGGAVARNSLDAESVDGVMPSIGIWGQTGPLRATASYIHARIGGETFPESSFVVSLSNGGLDLTTYAGLRQSPFEGQDESWVGGSAAYWFADRAAFVVSGGQYATDVVQGLPGGEFFSVGIRLTTRRQRPVPRRVPASFIYSSDDVRAGSGGLAFTASDANRVEIAGEFNGWQPEPLQQRADGRWMFSRPLQPGVYRFNLRIDGERWVVPEGFPSVEDGFGDSVGLLIISAN